MINFTNNLQVKKKILNYFNYCYPPYQNQLVLTSDLFYNHVILADTHDFYILSMFLANFF